jgi:hypothetical protein
VVDQRLDELRAAVDDDVTTLLLLQLRDLLREVAFQHCRVVPLRLLQGRGDHVLGHGVELVGELALSGGPGLGKALVRDAAQQQRLGRERFVELELVALVSAVDLEGPTSVLEALGSARVFHDTVERHELRYDDPSHLVPLLVGMSFFKTGR